jgi:hypothetical protein
MLGRERSSVKQASGRAHAQLAVVLSDRHTDGWAGA